MMMDLPNELIPYVRMSKKNGLVHSDDMPESLGALFEETKRKMEESIAERNSKLEELIADSSNQKK